MPVRPPDGDRTSWGNWTTDQVQLLSDLATSVITEIAFAKAATQAAGG